MSALSDDADLARWLAAIDAANAEDPNRIGGRALALVQGELATKWLARLDPDPPLALALAARAHHLRRWEIPRSSRPAGRADYLRWRRDLKDVHRRAAAEVLAPTGAPAATIAEVQRLLAKQGLGRDPLTQTFEDVVCLVFLETQFAPLTERLDDEKMIAVLRKTFPKMSPAARALAPDALPPGRGTALVEAALARDAYPD